MFSLLVFVASCALGPGNFESRQAADLTTRNVKRIAVLPLEPVGLGEKAPDTASVLSSFLQSTMASMPHWQIVSDREVREVAGQLSGADGRARARKLGELVYADAILTGRILRFRERVGESWGAKSPASVALVLELWDVKQGDLIWSGRFVETQRALSENIFALGEVAQRGLRWLKAEELAQEGIKKAVHQLHQSLYRKSA